MAFLIRTLKVTIIAGIFSFAVISQGVANAAGKAEIDRDVDAALQQLFASSHVAKMLAGEAKAILVFPRIVKAGFIVGIQGGNGALRIKGATTAYYNTASASYGLQAGIQKFGYALIFMSDSAVRYLENSAGWEIGVGPSIVVVDAGVARALTTTTARNNIYAFFFSQKGLMAGIGLQGTKITRIEPD